MRLFGESAQEAWCERFGTDAPEGAERIASFLTHRSVRDFGPEPIEEATLAALVGAAQSAATSSNLHAYSIVSVDDPLSRKVLRRLVGDQRQVEECARFLAFVVDLHRLGRAAELAGKDPTGLDTAEMFTVATVDAALAAERMVMAAESLGIGACYIGSLRNDPGAVAELLDLPERTFGLFGLCLGWPTADADARIKPRLGPEVVWHRERYLPDRELHEYDARLRAFYEREGINAGLGWIGRTGSRVTEKGLGGRETLLGFLRAHGLLKR